MAKLTEIEQRAVDLKLEGLNNKQIGAILYPNATTGTQSVLMTRLFKKKHIAKILENGLEQSLKRYNVTYDRLIKKLESKLDASKIDYKTGEVLEDNAVQMSALKTLLALLIDKDKKIDNPISGVLRSNDNYNPELVNAINNNVDDIELQRIIFKKNE